MLTTCSPVPEQVRKQFPQEDVEMKIFGPGKKGLTRGIRITFANSPLIGKSPEDRSQQAKETANIVKSHCPEIKDVEEIDVIFSKVSDIPGIFHADIPVEIFRFDNDANPLPPNKSPSEVLAETGSNTAPQENEINLMVSYSPSQNETEIFVEGIQLEGVRGNGLTMMPRLSVTGDTSRVTPRAPAFMRFDFASFAEKQRFTGLTPIAFAGDKLDYQTSGQFSTSRSNDGLISEFLYLTVPYATFRQMASGKSLTVTVGTHKYQLTDEQFRSLSKMIQYVKDE